MKKQLYLKFCDLEDDVYDVLRPADAASWVVDKANDDIDFPVRSKTQALKDSVVGAIHIYLNIPRGYGRGHERR